MSEILIGVYASKKAVQATYAEGNVYQANVDFLRQLSAQFQTKATYIGQEPILDSIGKFSKNMEAYYDYSGTMIDLTPADQEKSNYGKSLTKRRGGAGCDCDSSACASRGSL